MLLKKETLSVVTDATDESDGFKRLKSRFQQKAPKLGSGDQHIVPRPFFSYSPLKSKSSGKIWDPEDKLHGCLMKKKQIVNKYEA